jgi:hypothetical protein
MQRGKAEHFDANVPNAGGQIERIAAAFIGVGDDFGGAWDSGRGYWRVVGRDRPGGLSYWSCCNRGAWNE